jgi:hypothetical protein
VLAVATREDLKVGAPVQAIARRADVPRAEFRDEARIGRSPVPLFIHSWVISKLQHAVCLHRNSYPRVFEIQIEGFSTGLTPSTSTSTSMNEQQPLSSHSHQLSVLDRAPTSVPHGDQG